MNRSPVTELAEPLEHAVAELGGDGVPVRLERPADAAHGDYASAVALALARPLRSAPREIAARIGDRLSSPWIEAVEIAGPGFINLRVAPAFHRHVVERVLAEGAGYGAGAVARPLRLQVEYVSGNPTGPVTAATARNAAYGDSLARLFAFAGHRVEREYYFNDAGRQMELFGLSLRAAARGEDVPEDGYQGAYIKEIADSLDLDRDAPADAWREAGVASMMADIQRTLSRFRASFDVWFREGSLYEDGSVERAIERVRKGGHVFELDGATWLRTTDFGDDRDRVLVRSNGQPTYFAGDLAYVASKLERGFDQAVYVLGSDHHGYVGRLKGAAAALGYDPDRIDIQIYQFVHIVEDGQVLPVSKRRGQVLMLDELLDAIGVDAARYALVARSHDQVIELDPDELDRPELREPGLLLPVRARPDRGHPAQRRRHRAGGRSGLDPRAAGGRTGKGAGRLPRPGRRGGRAARPAPGRGLHPGHGESVPPVLQAVPGAGIGAAGRAKPARPVQRHQAGAGDRARPDRSRGAGLDVSLPWAA